MRTAKRILIAGLLVLTACTGTAEPDLAAQNQQLSEELQALLAGGLPAVPVHREPSTAAVWQVDGRDTYSRALNAVDNQAALDLISGTNSLSWGIWQFSLWLQTVQSVEVVADVNNGDQIYVALANFSNDAWDIRGPLGAGKILALEDALHRSAAGHVYVAVLAHGGSKATVLKLILSTDDGWVIVTADSAVAVGWDTSLAVIDGKPAISYHDFGNHDLKYTSSATSLGDHSADWSAVTVDSGGVVGRFTSLTTVAGQPAISYYDGTNLALKYARRNDVPADSWEIVMVNDDDLGEATGTYSSLVVAGGHPLITYYDASFDILMYSESSTPTGTNENDWLNFLWDSVPDVGRYSSAAIVDSEVGVSYYDGVDHDLRYMWRGEPVKVTVASAGLVGTYSSLAVADGKPAISYYDSSNANLRYAVSSTTRGTSDTDWHSIVIDSDGDVGSQTSLAIIDGRPAISYYDEGNTSLKFAWATTPAGAVASNWRTMTVDRAGNTGTSSSLAEVDGRPAISYYDADLQQLKYAIRLGP